MSSMIRLYDRNEGEYVSVAEVIKHLRAHPRPDGMVQPLLLWGSAGVGKCVTGDTRVAVNDILIPIEEVWARFAGEAEFDGEGEWATPAQKLLVPAVDEDGRGRLRPRRVTNLYRQRVRERGRRVRLDDGSEITMTARHRLLGLGGWTRDISIDDRVAVPSQLPRAQRGQALDADFVTLLAWQLAEGDESNQRTTPGALRITQEDVAELERVRECAARFGARMGIDMHSMPINEPAGKSPHLAISSRPYRSYLESLGYVWGHKSATKALPEFVQTADDHSVALFIGEYLACEGHVNPQNGMVEISTASREMAEALRMLLRRFGIWGRLKRKWKSATNGSGTKRIYWEILIGGASMRRLHHHIAIPHQEKQEMLELVAARECNSNVEGIPLGDVLLAAKSLTGLPPRHLGYCDSRSYKVGKGFTQDLATNVLVTLRAIADGTAEKACREAPLTDHYRTRRLAAYEELDREAVSTLVEQAAARVEVDAHWAKVVEVEDVWLDGYVYDLEVEEAHNYVAGGMITHNTARVMSYCRLLGLEMKIYLPAQDDSGADIVGERIADAETGKTQRLLPVWLPDAERDGPQGVLFIDEINRAPKSVRDGLLELVGDGTILQVGYHLPPGWSIVAAANPADLGHDVYDIDDAMVDRFIHMAPGYDPAVWAGWSTAQETMHESVIDYALAHPEEVDQGEAGFPLELQGRIKATPRAWANLGFLLDDQTPEGMRTVLAVGMVGRERAESYLRYWEAWQKGYRPLRFEQLLDRNEYEQVIRSWGQSQEAAGMIEASNERVIASLMVKPLDDNMATIVGRYLALIPVEFAERFFDSGARTIPSWLPLLREKTEQWRQALYRANQGQSH